MSHWHRLLSDAALVERARRDDPSAFEELVRRYQRVAYALAAAAGVSRSNRDDVVQESFLRAFRGLPGMEEAHKFGAWLRQIVRRESLRSLERMPPARAGEELDVADTRNPDVVEGMELRTLVLGAVQSLPLELREVVFAYYYDGLSTRQAARSVGISVSSFKHRLQRSRDLLRVRLGREFAEELGIPPTDRTNWQRRARSLSLVVVSTLPALRPSSASAAASGINTTASSPWFFQFIQAGGIMSVKNVTLGFIFALAITGAVMIWWLVPTGQRSNDTNLGGEREHAVASVEGNGVRAGREESPGDPSQEPKAIGAATQVETPRQDPPALEGRVLDLRGRPVAGARVIPISSAALSEALGSIDDTGREPDPLAQVRALRQSIHKRLGGARSVTTDEEGRYAVQSLSAGEHRILVVHPSFLPLTEAWVEVTSAGTATRDVTLEDAKRIHGRVRTEGGAPIAGARIAARRAERRDVKGIGSMMEVAMGLANGTDLLALDSVTTGPAGEFELGSLEPSLYDLRAMHDGHLAGVLENVEAGSDVELRLSPARALRGRAVDSAGKPIGLATVTLRTPRPVGDVRNPLVFLTADVDLRDEKTRSANCTPDGGFVIFPPEKGVFEVVLSASGFLESKRVEKLGEREVQLGNVTLESGQTLRGFVLAASGAPANARVWATRAQPANRAGPQVEELATARTADDGSFELGPLPADDLVVTAVDDALGSIEKEHRRRDPTTLELRIPVGQVVEGKIVDATSREPITGASVTWSYAPARKTVSAEDGSFRFAGVPADLEKQYGRWVHIAVEHPRYQNSLSREEWTQGKSIQIALKPQPGAHGIVVDASGSPVAGARVAIEAPGLPPEILILARETSFRPGGVFSSAEGRFEVCAGLWVPGSGAIDIVATHPAHGRGRVTLKPTPSAADPEPRGETRVTLQSDEDLTIVLRPGAQLEAMVRDASGAPVKQARVSLERSADLPPTAALLKEVLSGLVASVGFTDESGHATLRNLEPGKYDLVASAVGFANRRQNGIEITPDRASADIVLERGRDLSGRVVDGLLAPVSGAEIVAFEHEAPSNILPARSSDEQNEIGAIVNATGQGSAAARSDPQGRFTLSDLAPGKYRLIVRGEDILPAELESAAPGQRLADFQVERCVTLAFVVREAASGAPVTHFRVTLQPQTTASDSERFTDEVSNAEGKLERGQIAPGLLGLEIQAAGYATWRALAALAGGARREIAVSLHPARRVDGLVRSTVTGAPIADASVFLSSGVDSMADALAREARVLETLEIDDRGFHTDQVWTDAHGRFTISDARDGEFRISVWHSEFYDPQAMSRAPVVLLGGAAELTPIELAPGATIKVVLEGLKTRESPGDFLVVDAIPSAPAIDAVSRNAGPFETNVEPAPPPDLRRSSTVGIDPEGHAQIAGLAPGTYELHLRVLRLRDPSKRNGRPEPDGEPRQLGTITVGEQETATFTRRIQE